MKISWFSICSTLCIAVARFLTTCVPPPPFVNACFYKVILNMHMNNTKSRNE